MDSREDSHGVLPPPVIHTLSPTDTGTYSVTRSSDLNRDNYIVTILYFAGETFVIEYFRRTCLDTVTFVPYSHLFSVVIAKTAPLLEQVRGLGFVRVGCWLFLRFKL